MIGLLCVATVLLSVFTYSMNTKYVEQLKLQKDILKKIELQESEMANQSTIISNQADTITKLQEQLAGNTLNSLGQTTEDLITMVENHEDILQDHGEILNELKAFADDKKEESLTIKFVPYKVVKGDNLYNICEAHGINYNDYIKIILAINGIKDANQIYVGQLILLPNID